MLWISQPALDTRERPRKKGELAKDAEKDKPSEHEERRARLDVSGVRSAASIYIHVSGRQGEPGGPESGILGWGPRASEENIMSCSPRHSCGARRDVATIILPGEGVRLAYSRSSNRVLQCQLFCSCVSAMSNTLSCLGFGVL